jgi:hypothetical protein
MKHNAASIVRLSTCTKWEEHKPNIDRGVPQINLLREWSFASIYDQKREAIRVSIFNWNTIRLWLHSAPQRHASITQDTATALAHLTRFTRPHMSKTTSIGAWAAIVAHMLLYVDEGGTSMNSSSSTVTMQDMLTQPPSSHTPLMFWCSKMQSKPCCRSPFLNSSSFATWTRNVPSLSNGYHPPYEILLVPMCKHAFTQLIMRAYVWECVCSNIATWHLSFGCCS